MELSQIELEARFAMMASQRNAALDQAVMLAGELAKLRQEILELKPKEET